jgi:quercetin dioxygenase-like cupin family protein
VYEDPRGSLTLVSFEQVPFVPERVYVLGDIPPGVRRAGHACRRQQRFLVSLSGHAAVTLDDGHTSERVEIARGDTLHLAPGTWHEIEAADATVGILVLADGPHDPADYVTDRSRLPIASTTAAPTSET